MTETNDPALAQAPTDSEAPREPAVPSGQDEAPMDQPETTAEPNPKADLETAQPACVAGAAVSGATSAEAGNDEGPADEPPTESPAGEPPAHQPAADSTAREHLAASPAGEPSAENPAHEPAADSTARERLAESQAHEPPGDSPADAHPADSTADERLAGGRAGDPSAESRTDEPPAHSPAAESPADSEVQPAPEPEATEQAPVVELAPAAIPFAAALEAKNPIEGRVIGWNKGGFHIVSEGVTTFCPRSLMELGNRPRSPARYVNNTYTFHVLEIKEAGRRIVLTRRPAIRNERKQALEDLHARQESREPISGKVTSVTDFGAFVDLGGGLGGLVHRTQISRSRSGEPGDLLKVGQSVRAVVTKIEKKNGKRSARISLSMKALEADPWKEAARNFTAGAKFKGKVVRHSEFGLFVELAPGLDGLVHTSQLPIGKQMSAPEFATGEEIEGWVVEVTPKRRRIALSLREVPADDPWKSLGAQYVEGSEVEGRVEQVSRFGIFVELEPGLTGLLPMSAVTLPDGNQAQRAYPPGRQLKVVIESIDRRRRRLGLAPPGSQLVGTKADYKNYRKRQKKPAGLNAMAAAFAKLQQSK